MADVKISGLPASTTPLAGTEVLPVVQGTTTKQVSVANLTAGRAVSAASLALTSAPLPTTSGGTALTSFTLGGLLYASSTNTLTTNSALQFNGTHFGVGTNTSFGVGNREINLNAASGIASLNLGVNGVLTGWLYSGASSTFLTSYGAYPLLLGTNGAERARVFASGGVSIGDTTDPGANNLRLGTGNLVIGTSGKGIDFSATAGTGTSELLNDYEEGTWTPLQGANITVVGTFSASGTYTKVGRIVTIRAVISGSTSVAWNASACEICTGLPYAGTGGNGLAYNQAFTIAAGVVSGAAAIVATEPMAATPQAVITITYQT